MAKILAPLVVDLGKAKRRQIKDLLRGEGELLQDAQQAIEQVRAGLGADADGKRVLPIVLVYKKKRRDKFFKLPLPF
jgi:hypothetical protein